MDLIYASREHPAYRRLFNVLRAGRVKTGLASLIYLKLFHEVISHRTGASLVVDPLTTTRLELANAIGNLGLPPDIAAFYADLAHTKPTPISVLTLLSCFPKTRPELASEALERFIQEARPSTAIPEPASPAPLHGGTFKDSLFFKKSYRYRRFWRPLQQRQAILDNFHDEAKRAHASPKAIEIFNGFWNALTPDQQQFGQLAPLARPRAESGDYFNAYRYILAELATKKSITNLRLARTAAAFRHIVNSEIGEH